VLITVGYPYNGVAIGHNCVLFSHLQRKRAIKELILTKFSVQMGGGVMTKLKNNQVLHRQASHAE
jgi:hypothetical protein